MSPLRPADTHHRRLLPIRVGALRQTITDRLDRLPRTPRRIVVTVWRLPQYLLIGLFTLWRLAVSPLYGQTCKYYPSCSAYGLEAVRRHGAIRGLGLTSWRLLRCNPWSHGGVDDVPSVRTGHDRADRAAVAPTDRPATNDPRARAARRLNA